MSTKELLHALSRYDTKRKVNSNRRKIFKMGQKKLLNYKIFRKMI